MLINSDFIRIDFDKCLGSKCKLCYDMCPMDILDWDEEADRPFVLYPEECCYSGNCSRNCPAKCFRIELPTDLA